MTDNKYTLKSLSTRTASRFSNSDMLGVLVIASLGLNALVLITQLFLYSSYSNLSKKPVPTLVQLSSGEAIATTTLGNKERSPVVIAILNHL